MYESTKEYKKRPGTCFILGCDGATMSSQPKQRGNYFEVKVTCAKCKSTWRDQYILMVVSDLRVSPQGKKLLKEAKDKEADGGEFAGVNVDTPPGRMEVGL